MLSTRVKKTTQHELLLMVNLDIGLWHSDYGITRMSARIILEPFYHATATSIHIKSAVVIEIPAVMLNGNASNSCKKLQME